MRHDASHASQVLRAHGQLSRYLDRYRTRLSPSNAVYVTQLLFFLAKFRCVTGARILVQRRCCNVANSPRRRKLLEGKLLTGAGEGMAGCGLSGL
jgi:hypothetical protein